MKFTDKPFTRPITVLAQDPAVLGQNGLPVFTNVNVPNERLAPGPKGARFHVIDYDTALDKYIAPNGGTLLDFADLLTNMMNHSSFSAAAKKNVWAILSDEKANYHQAVKVYAQSQHKNTAACKPAASMKKNAYAAQAKHADYNSAVADFSKLAAKLIKTDGFSKPVKARAANALTENPHFHAQNVYGHAASTLLTFERALGRHVYWGLDSQAHLMKIAPHAFNDMNAFYSRRDEMLAFGYFSDPGAAGKFVFTALSADVIVHETTHAILDGLRSEFMKPSSIDQGAFHEGFADIVALLSAFKSKDMVGLALGGPKGSNTIAKTAVTPKPLRKTFLAGMARQFGQALTALYGGEDNHALRRSAEIEPDAGLYEREKQTAEVHDFGEVLVAPIINAFLEIWCVRVAPLDPVSSGRIDRARAIKEGCKAADHLLGMCIRALDYLPPVNMTYHNYLRAILTADKETAIDDSKYNYRKTLRDSFHAYGIKKNRKGDNDLWSPPRHADEICYGYAGHSEMQWDRESVHRFLWENSVPLGLNDEAFTKVVSVRPVKRRAPDGTIVKETVVEYMQTLHMFARHLSALEIQKPKDMPPGEWVKLYGGGTLIFNDYGGLKYHIGTGVTSKKQTSRLASLRLRATDKKARRFAHLHSCRAKGETSRRRKEQWS